MTSQNESPAFSGHKLNAVTYSPKIEFDKSNVQSTDSCVQEQLVNNDNVHQQTVCQGSENRNNLQVIYRGNEDIDYLLVIDKRYDDRNYLQAIDQGNTDIDYLQIIDESYEDGNYLQVIDLGNEYCSHLTANEDRDYENTFCSQIGLTDYDSEHRQATCRSGLEENNLSRRNVID